MLELPEVLNLASQLNEHAASKKIDRVLPPTKPHKFCWFSGNPADYHAALRGTSLSSAEGFGIYLEMRFSNGQRLAVNDGVNLRLLKTAEVPGDYQLLIVFDDDTALVFTVGMYGGIVLHTGMEDNVYYQASLHAVSPLCPTFPSFYRSALDKAKPTLSLKAFLATEQRFPGLGNGVLQDILFEARLNPRRKLKSLSPDEHERLLNSVVCVMQRMIERGGRDTERGLFGEAGGYESTLSRNTLARPCPVCGTAITKETYMGGAIYYCPCCQPKPSI